MSWQETLDTSTVCKGNLVGSPLQLPAQMRNSAACGDDQKHNGVQEQEGDVVILVPG